MSFILRSHRDRYRQRSRENLYRTIALLFTFIACIIIGYVGGQKKYAQEVRQIDQHMQELETRTAKAEQDAMDLRTNYQILSVKHDQLQSEYKRDVPQGDLNMLTSMVKEQLDKGLAVDRMAQIIRSAQPPQNCSPPVNKRLIVSTPLYNGPESVVIFADGLITVKSKGEPSINNKQNKEAWFDPGKPVTVNFTIIGGKNEHKTGLLPLHHTVILKGKEYRFTISEGPRSFIVVTGDNCDYPEALQAQTSGYDLAPIEPVPSAARAGNN